MNNFKSFKILGHDTILLNGIVEVSAPNEDIGSKIIVKLSPSILDNRFSKLKLNLPTKTIIVSAYDKNHIKMRAESNNSANMN